ncbi:NADH-quinone oxidoreductase subunit L, partial [Streptomyces iconiensis]|nr:NADH-quinone oxidoreductase subunit L [Streptomyces iconiensis]
GAGAGARVRGVTFSVAALSLAGLPPFAIWAAKDVLLAAARTESPGAYAAALAASVVAAVYSTKLLYVVWHRTLPHSTPAKPPHPSPEPGPASNPVPGPPASREVRGAAPLLVLALACAGLTAVAFPPLRGDFVGGGQPVEGWEFAASGAGALLVCAVVWKRGAVGRPAPGPVSGWLLGWLGLERAVRTVLVAPTLGLARALAAFDVRVLDRALEGAARAVLRTARFTAGRVEPVVDGAVGGLAAASRALGRRALWPQTGQLHQYLAQAVAACVLLAFVLVLVR